MTKYSFKRLLYILALAFTTLFSTLSLCAKELIASPQYEHLTILHTNDFHGNDPYNLAKYATIINQVRTEAKNVLVLDAGDLFSRGPYHTAFYGELEMATLNEIGYDAWVLGNNEFKCHAEQSVTDEKIAALINQANFPTLCANILMKDTNALIEGTKPYTVVDVNGLKVGIIGITSEKIPNYPQSTNKSFVDGFETVQSLLPEVAKISDIQIILSHADLSVDAKIVSDIWDQEIAAVIGADDHYIITAPIYQVQNGDVKTPIVQAGGENNAYVGRLDLTFEVKDGKYELVKHRGMLYAPDENVPLDPAVKHIIDTYLATLN